MHKIRFLTGGALFVALIAGFGYAVATERPVAQMNHEIPAQPIVVEQPSTASTSTPATITQETKLPTPPSNPNDYTRAQVAQHDTVKDCWTSIEGNVYNLTTWVTRHPGGSETITALCGTDGTGMFKAQHNSSRAARAALVLLKIGTLK